MTVFAIRIAQVFGSALVLMWASELFFLNDGPVQALFDRYESRGFGAAFLATLELGMFYMLFSYPLLICLNSFAVHSWAGAVLAAAVYGVSVEALLVPLIYESLPGSIIWPSLSWHLLIDVGLIWLGLRLALRAQRNWVAIVSMLGIGALWAFQATWYWIELLPGELPKLDFDRFALLVACSFPSLALGVIIADTTAHRAFRAHRSEIVLILTISVIMFVSIGLPHGIGVILVAGVYAALLSGLWAERARAAKVSAWPPFARLAVRPPVWRFAFLLLVPVGALVSYALILETRTQQPTELVVQTLALTGAFAVVMALLTQLRSVLTSRRG
ncbi:MAG: hypothetical protein ACWA47_07325 [Brevirhabdus sp.]